MGKLVGPLTGISGALFQRECIYFMHRFITAKTKSVHSVFSIKQIYPLEVTQSNTVVSMLWCY